MKPHNSTRLLLIALLLFILAQVINAAPPENPKSITKEEFMELFKKERAIDGRRIPSHTIADAIRWAQDAAGRKEKIPSRLTISNSVIGSHDGMLAPYLRVTPINNLPPDLRQLYEVNLDISRVFSWYSQEKPEDIAIIPIEIRIENSIVYNGLDFSDVIFQRAVSFSGSVISQVARFTNSTFRGPVIFGSAVLDEADFAQTRFLAPALFGNITFSEGVNFSGAKFHDWTFFDNAKFENKLLSAEPEIESESRIAFVTFDKRVSFAGAIFSGKTHFFFTTFLDEAAFNQAIIQGQVSFVRCLFTKISYFSQLKEGSHTSVDESHLSFSGTSFKDRVYFDNVEIKAISFKRLIGDSQEAKIISEIGLMNAESENKDRLLIPPTIIDGRVDFTNLKCAEADFSDVEFRSYVDFSRAKFTKFVTFNNAAFEEALNFTGTGFPPFIKPQQNQESMNTGLILDGVRFQKTINLEWNQVAHSLNTQRQDTWRLLEDAFKRSGNLEGQNEAMYQRRLREGAEANGLKQKSINIFERIYWGYGVRPWRLIGWMLFLLAIFTYFYWTQTKAMAEGKSKQQGRRDRLQYALAFSLHSSRSLTYGYQNSRTPLFKFLTLFQAIGFIVLTLCLLQALANISPLLNQLVGKLLPL